MRKPTFDPLSIQEAVDTAIHAYLGVLILRLQSAEALAVEAAAAIATGNRNRAIGTILPLEQALPECDALVRASLILHRMSVIIPNEGGAA